MNEIKSKIRARMISYEDKGKDYNCEKVEGKDLAKEEVRQEMGDRLDMW